jgi:hypothetical protein
MRILYALLFSLIPCLLFSQSRSELNTIPNYYFAENDEFGIKKNEGSELLYKKDSDIPYTGEVITHFDFGEIKIKGYCQNGVKTGVWEIFKETTDQKTTKEKVFAKRSSKEANEIAKIRKCIVGYDWKWKSPILERDYLQYRFYSDGTFRKSVLNARPPHWVEGTWSINKIKNNSFIYRFEIDKKCTNSSERKYTCDREIYFASCSKFAIYNPDWYKAGLEVMKKYDNDLSKASPEDKAIFDAATEYFYYHKSDTWSESSTETMEESLEKSQYSNEYTWKEETKTIKGSTQKYLLEYNKDGDLVKYKEWDRYSSVKYGKYTIEFDEYGIVKTIEKGSQNLLHQILESKDINRNITSRITSENESLFHTYEEFYPDGKIKKRFTFRRNKNDLFDSVENSSKYINKLLDNGYQLFDNEQNVFHKNGEVKYSVTFDQKSIKKIKTKEINTQQNYYLHKEKYYGYIGKGYEYDEYGEKIQKIYWDQYGRICDKNGNITSSQKLNVDINAIILKKIKGLF